MKNKVFVEVYVPVLEEKFDLFIPINKKLKIVRTLLIKAISELTFHSFPIDENVSMYSKENASKYDLEITVLDSDIRNGTKIVLL